MDKDEIILTKKNIADWVSSLKNVDDASWFQTFKEGSWGTADVIAHFISWNIFLLENRLPFIVQQIEFPKIKVDVEEINKKASIYN